MDTKGLNLQERDIEKSSKLILALKELPAGTIEGLSDYDPSYVFLKENKVIIKRPSTCGDALIVNFPEDSVNNVARYGVISFEYNGYSYEIYQ